MPRIGIFALCSIHCRMDQGNHDNRGNRGGGYSFARSSTPDYSTNIDRSEGVDTIPDVPENKAVRDFLKNAPKTGLHMPLGKEVKTMQCWRCKGYGHRTGDKECPMKNGNIDLDLQRQAQEDPMMFYVDQKQLRRQEKYERVEQLMLIMEEIRKEEAQRKARKHDKKKHKHSKRSHDSKDDHKESKRSKT